MSYYVSVIRQECYSRLIGDQSVRTEHWLISDQSGHLFRGTGA